MIGICDVSYYGGSLRLLTIFPAIMHRRCCIFQIRNIFTFHVKCPSIIEHSVNILARAGKLVIRNIDCCTFRNAYFTCIHKTCPCGSLSVCGKRHRRCQIRQIQSKSRRIHSRLHVLRQNGYTHHKHQHHTYPFLYFFHSFHKRSSFASMVLKSKSNYTNIEPFFAFHDMNYSFFDMNDESSVQKRKKPENVKISRFLSILKHHK